MTGYTVHSGTSDQYSSGWDAIFGGNKPAAKSAPAGKKSTSKKPAAKAPAAKKSTSKKPAKKGKK